MKLSRTLAVVCSAMACANAFIVKDSKISFKDEALEAVEVGAIEASTEKPAPITLSSIDEVLNFKFKLDLSKSKSKEVPEQLSLLVGVADRNLEIAVVPKVKDSSKNNKVKLVSFKVDVAALPSSVLHYAVVAGEKITATLIVANEQKNLARKEENIFQQVFDLEFAPEVAHEFVDFFEAPERYVAKPELAHTFPAAPETVPAGVASVFGGAILFVNVFLYMYWFYFNAISFSNMPTGGDFITFAIFFGSVVACEVVFGLYYLGTGIFETINTLAIVAPVGLIAGTKFLRSFSKRI
ncbi:dolichyl-diphosphooligosaccharide-protein glycotransferase [Maudiozyma humilis]|uniref:Dolichyl-diphosphooligosaccharide-protein glycotransferase n=1 Tax=Maudiozyma humilis TaxID=51915 RepID=A0AAV5RU77_MAUHU|nr:dolichyl-diphosphooligosaccharide-protein glycotransferase [Kazachstania humilis]